LLKIIHLKFYLAGLAYFYRITMRASLQMKFLRFLLLIFFVCGINVFSVAQSDSISYPISTDTVAVKDTLPPSVFIAGISLYGNDKTKDFIIRREIPFKEGDTVKAEKLIKSLKLQSGS
jgi:hypothetical protein